MNNYFFIKTLYLLHRIYSLISCR